MEKVSKYNTYKEIELMDGSKVELTLTFYALYQLKAKNKALYERYNEVVTKGAKDEFDNITVLYAAYCCANLNNDNLMSEETFMQMLVPNREAIAALLADLLKPKKK